MTQEITVQPNEQGTAKVTIVPTDENGDTLLFSELISPQWQLMRLDGTVINNRAFADTALTALVFIVSGDDLVIFGDKDDGQRKLSFQATYNSDLGNGLPLKDECLFTIAKLLGQIDSE